MKRELLPRYDVEAFTDSGEYAEISSYTEKEGDWVR